MTTTMKPYRAQMTMVSGAEYGLVIEAESREEANKMAETWVRGVESERGEQWKAFTMKEVTETGLHPIGEYLLRMTNNAKDDRAKAKAKMSDETTPDYMVARYHANTEYHKGEIAAYEKVAGALAAAGVIDTNDWRAVFHGYDAVNGLDMHHTGDYGHVSCQQWLVKAIEKAGK